MKSTSNVDEVRAELEKILSSRAFSGADRASSLLRYIVDETLSGKSGALKEYTLAVEVLGRKPSFDPRTDPIVRVEAGRLRAKLEEYYQSEGSGDDLCITVPKGGYVPSFSRRERQPRRRVRSPQWRLITAALALSIVLVAVMWYSFQRPSSSPALIEKRLTTNSSESPLTAAAISPDGKYLAYADSTGNHLRLLATAEIHSLSAIPDSKTVQLHWLPDGTTLLASVAHVQSAVPSVWSLSILGGPPRKLRDGAEHAVVSPDGSQIAFVGAGGKQIWVMEPGGQQPHRVLATPEANVIRNLAWAPDGRHLAYLREHSGIDKFEMAIEYCGLDGQEHRTLFVDPSNGSAPHSVPSSVGGLIFLNKRLIFTLVEPQPRQTDSNLWEIDFDYHTGIGGKSKRISNWSGVSISGLTQTADGKSLTFLKDQNQMDVYLADIDASRTRVSNIHRLTFDDRNDIPFDWTPDSKAVIFGSDRNGTSNIFKQRMDQTSAEAVVADAENEWVPAVSANGAWVVYLTFPKDSRFPAARGRFFRVPIGGGPAEFIMTASPGSIVQCARTGCVLNERSPDRKHLVFYDFDPLLGKGPEIVRMNATLTSFYNWSISRDGSSIAVLIPGEGDGRIRLLPIHGGNDRDLIVKGWPNLQFIDGAADGNGWYASSSSASTITLLHIDPQGHAQSLLANVGWAIESPDGRHLALLKSTPASNAWMVENF